MLNAGINPDIPKRAYEAFYAKTYSWDMTDIERAEYCEALESRDAGAIQKLHGISRRNSMEIAADICLAFQGMVESAHVPASALMSRDDA